jgi:hypothetical protein
MTALVSYSTGTVSVAAGGTTVTGTGTIWSRASVLPGDVLQIGNVQSIICDVVDVDELTIPPWGGGEQTSVAYKIWQVSPQRFAGEQAMKNVNLVMAALDTTGFFFFVGADEAEPNPSYGDEGQYGFQPTTGKMWAKVSGAWSYLGIYKAFQLRGAYSGATTYSVGDVVTESGSSYVWINDTSGSDHAPPNATYWQLLASKGDTGSAGLGPVAAWTTGHDYVAGPPADYVSDGGSSYMCLVDHTSGTFAADLAAGKWGLVAQKGADGTAPPAYGGTSATSFAIGTGSKAFTTQAGLAYSDGARVRASSAGSPGNWMEGVATYAGTTLTIAVDRTAGSGTFADWNFNIGGEPGDDGTSSLSDVDRRNSLLERIYQAKLFGGFRRFINAFADGFKTSTGIAAGSSSNYAVDTTNGFVQPTSAYAANMTSLLHFDGSNGSTTITESGIARTWTNHTGAISTAQSKFGGSSYNCGAGAGWVDTPDSADFTLGGSDFTVDFWFYVSGGSGARRFAAGQMSSSGTTGAWFTELNASNVLSATVYKASAQTTVTGTTAITTTGWHHAAFVRTGNNLMLFLDGVQEGSTTAFTGSVDDSADVLSVGRGGTLASLQWNGYIDEFRLSKGVARWTAGFTPPASAYAPIVDAMTLVTAAQTADSAVGNGRVLIEFDNADAPTLDTDLTVEVTCNGGANWAAAALSSVSTNGQGGRKIVETVDQVCTGGTSFAARIKTFNGKNVPIHGVSLTVH